jgi:hypothetical protein
LFSLLFIAMYLQAAPDMREALLEVLGARIADYAGDGSADDLCVSPRERVRVCVRARRERERQSERVCRVRT